MKKFIITLRVCGLLSLIIGLAIMAPAAYYQSRMGSVVAQVPFVQYRHAVPVQPGVVFVSGHPIAITIPSLHLALPVIDGAYNPKSAQWTLTSDKAQFALPSTTPNNVGGNTLIYGHATWGVFGHLSQIQPGAQAIISTSSNHRFIYTYTSTHTFDPADTSIFEYTGQPRLTLQTCSGTFSQNRQMYYFTYNSYQE